jgi:hypothetical protein
MYSRTGYVAIKAETTDNTAVKPDKFLPFVKADLQAKWAEIMTKGIFGTRDLNSAHVPGPVEAPKGSITVEVEGKTFGHLLKAVMGSVTSGVLFPITAASGAFSVGETVTGGTSAKTAVVLAVSSEEDYLLVGTLSGAFTLGETITGGTSLKTAVLGAYDATVYGHEAKAPQSTLPSFTVEIGLDNEAYRFCGVRFPAFKSLAAKDNQHLAELDVVALSAFTHARVTGIVAAGSAKTVLLDQTQGLTTADTVKVFRPSTGAFLDLSGAGVKTSAVTTVNPGVSIVIPTLTDALAVDDILVLAPQTPSYAVSRVFTWIGGSVGRIGDTLTAAIAATCAGMETFDLSVTNEFEERHRACTVGVAGRFPSAILLKGFKAEGKFKRAYTDQAMLGRLRSGKDTAIQVRHTGDLIGATGIRAALDWRVAAAVFKPWSSPLDEDALLDEEVPFEAVKGSPSTVKALLINDVASY